MSTKSKLPFLKLGHSPKIKDVNRIVVMGSEDVGKTALIVRFLTRKYLPEYTHGNITCYERNILIDDKDVSIRIIDTSGKETYSSLEKQDIFHHVDGFLVVYSVTDKTSFVTGGEMLKQLHQDFSTKGAYPVALIANKTDLTHLRIINTIEGQRLALIYPRCSFYECSAAGDPKNVDVAFREFIREVMQSKDSKKHLHVNSSLTVKSPNPRRNSAGNSTLSSWWKRPRSSSACENRQDRTFTM
ncbi:ras-related and estrogen-regulated growth inhibitor-like protein [Uloborus diversus]|uniref:ras-related and estrogen-regulated growth inhibitor-like protein n=1 Tax=Uloborus diversus TaxID=327109 RepID=UPI00240989DA|nr:ras-related and estrogen-regulated growth inhibitor-like protein [Uloborus diversus]